MIHSSCKEITGRHFFYFLKQKCYSSTYLNNQVHGLPQVLPQYSTIIVTCHSVYLYVNLCFLVLLYFNDRCVTENILWLAEWENRYKWRVCEKELRAYKFYLPIHQIFYFLLLPLLNNTPFLHCLRVLRIQQVDWKDPPHLFQCFPLYRLLRMECQRQSLTPGICSRQEVKVQQTLVLVVTEVPLLPPPTV